MTKVNVTIDGIILHCDNSVANINLGNGYKIEKKYFSDLPYKNKITGGEGKLTINYLGSQMKDFYRYRSESLHEGNGQNITVLELKDLEEIVRRVLVKYLEFCKLAIQTAPTVTWDTIKRDKISDLKNTVSTVIPSGILPA